MPLEGSDKEKYNWVANRLERQDAFWPGWCKQWDENAKGKRFRSEVRSMSDLYRLYRRGVTEFITPEEEARGKKPEKIEKGYEVVPAKAFEVPGRYSEKGLHHKGEHGYLHFSHWLLARDQCRKDLYWLGRTVLQRDFEPHVHQFVCDQFVQKDFDGIFNEGFTLREMQAAFRNLNRVPRIWVNFKEYSHDSKNQAALLEEEFGKYIPDPNQVGIQINFAKTMILLDPRGFFKSTIDNIDTIQWLINCPDARVLIVSGVKDLAEKFLLDAKRYFYLPKSIKPGYFHLLFPEYVLRGVDGTSKEDLIVSERQHNQIDASLAVTSVGSSKAGNHCDVLKFDDIVTETNCLTEDTREAILQKADSTRNLLMSWGWHDAVGTRYYPDDYYGRTKEVHDKAPDEFNLKYFVRACWTVKPPYQHYKLEELTVDMVNLTFPEQEGSVEASFKHLKSILTKNPKEFRCQQLNQPVWGDDNPTFPPELLRSRKSAYGEAVRIWPGEYFVGAIDLAKDDKRFSDFSCIAVGKVYAQTSIMNVKVGGGIEIPQEEQKFFLVVLDVDFGKWSQYEQAYKIAAMNNKWHKLTGQFIRWRGEDTGGLEVFKEKIANVSKEIYGHWPNIYWPTPENTSGAKVSRIKGMEVVLRDSRMTFLNADWNDRVFEQLEKYTGQKSSRTVKDDVPDALSRLVQSMPRAIPLSPKELEAQAAQKEEEYRKRILALQHEQIFGSDSGGFGLNQSWPIYGQELPSQPESTDPNARFRRGMLGGGPWR